MLVLFGFSTAAAIETASGAVLTELTTAHDEPQQDAEPTSPAGRSSPLAAPITITTTEEISAVEAITIGTAISIGAAITATGPITGAAVLTDADELTATATITADAAVTNTALVTNTEGVTSTGALTDSVDLDEQLDEQYDEVVVGTIVANRTDANVRFFLEGDTFLIDPQRAIGLELPRVTAVLSLYNCDADRPESEVECYWDPYLLNRDGFYEVVGGADEGLTVSLSLREAGAPPVDQVWIQNRTGKGEIVVYKSVTYELAPATVQEFTVSGDALPTFFLRSCVEVDETNVCEWAPVVVDSGYYYGLEEQSSVGGLPNSRLSSLTLRPVLAGVGEEAIEDVVENTPAQIICSVLVPALNVRSGPGLEYEIVAKIRGTDEEPATIVVIGQNETGEWLAVAERIADGGWVTGSLNYVACEGDFAVLPVSEITDGRLAPTPEPVAVAPQAETPVEGDAEAETVPVESTDAVSETAAVGTAPAAQKGWQPCRCAMTLTTSCVSRSIRISGPNRDPANMIWSRASQRALWSGLAWLHSVPAVPGAASPAMRRSLLSRNRAPGEADVHS